MQNGNASFGAPHVVAATESVLYMCGCGHDGRLGTGSEANVVGLTLHPFFVHHRVRNVYCGGFHSFVFCDDGVFAFGHNEHGQLGLGTWRCNVLKPTRVDFFDGRLESVNCFSCGAYHSAAIVGTELFVCGRNDHGQLGLGNYDDVKSFTQVAVAPGFVPVQVSAGSYHTLLLLKANARSFRDDKEKKPDAPTGHQPQGDSCNRGEESGRSATCDGVDVLSKVQLNVVAACGKGDFGELGYDADEWDTVESTEHRVKLQVGARALHARLGGDVDELGEPGAPPSLPKPFKVNQKTAVQRRRQAFSHPSFKEVRIPTSLQEEMAAETNIGGTQPIAWHIASIHAMHHHSTFTLSDGRTFTFGCKYCNEIEDDSTSTPALLGPLPSGLPLSCLHAGDEYMFALDVKGNAFVKGKGCIGLASSDSFCPAWTPLPLPMPPMAINEGPDSETATVEAQACGVSHCMITLNHNVICAFGDNYMAQLGLCHDDPVETCVRVEVPEPRDGLQQLAVNVASGFRHTLIHVRYVPKKDANKEPTIT